MGPDQIIRELRATRKRLEENAARRLQQEADTLYHRWWRANNREHHNLYQRQYKRLQKLRAAAT